MPTVQKVAEGFLLGEGPHWDVASQRLYFIDYFGKDVVKYTQSTQTIAKATPEKPPSFIIPIEGKSSEFVISQGNELVVISWDGVNNKITVVEKLDGVDLPKSFNDAKCDSSGRLWAGCHDIATDFTKTKPVGILFSLDSTKKLKSHVDKIHVSNGMAFNDKTGKMYYIDTLKETVDQFDLNIKSGTLSNRRVWFSFENRSIPGVPDGMTIDSDGNLWIAVFGGSRVLKIDGNIPQTLLDTIEIPTEQVTSVAFGGQNFDELYVTTGAIEFGGKPAPSTNGATYRVTGLGVKGLPAVNFKLYK